MRREVNSCTVNSEFCWHQKHSKTDLNYLGVKYLPLEPFPHQKIAHEWAAFARVCSIRHSLHFFSLANWKWMFSLKKGFGFWGCLVFFLRPFVGKDTMARPGVGVSLMWMSWYTIGRHFCPISRVLRFGSDWIRSLAGFATLLHHFSGRTTSSVGCGFCTRCGAFLSRILEAWLYYNGDNTCLRNTVDEESAKGRTCVYIYNSWEEGKINVTGKAIILQIIIISSIDIPGICPQTLPVKNKTGLRYCFLASPEKLPKAVYGKDGFRVAYLSFHGHPWMRN